MNTKNLPDGFYLLSNTTNTEVCLVKIYSHPDFNNERRVVFGLWDGGGAISLQDLTANSVLRPADINVGTTPTNDLDAVVHRFLQW